jgi:hypothetical protein
MDHPEALEWPVGEPGLSLVHVVTEMGIDQLFQFLHGGLTEFRVGRRDMTDEISVCKAMKIRPAQPWQQ